ncbi:PhnD/SsuA/transferrin family substrate-binding protein [Weissella confusa]|uniref:PhnD/SsuA/transferrin family substrate-binding protein n=1 Tax=Weissella confusa TaxID=1583 RepID=A0A923NEL7_WEICO|nr:PhnD/SsuA/transferrin family substrate-binding protein [Weissella confusa]
MYTSKIPNDTIALRKGISAKDSKAITDKLVDYYRAIVLVKKDSKIKSVKDLKGKKIAVQDTTSDAGYMFPVVDLKKKGMNVVKDSDLVTVMKQLGIPVHVTISTDYNTVVEAMGSKKVDMGFLPPDPYVHAHEQYGAKVILQSERYGINDKKGDGSMRDMFKKLVAGAALTIAASTLVTALPAASVDAASKKVSLKELNVQFVPSSQADTIQAKAKPLEKLLIISFASWMKS